MATWKWSQNQSKKYQRISHIKMRWKQEKNEKNKKRDKLKLDEKKHMKKSW